MESGFTRQLFIRWSADPRNSVIITSRTAKGTLARTLIDDPKISKVTLQVSGCSVLKLFSVHSFQFSGF